VDAGTYVPPKVAKARAEAVRRKVERSTVEAAHALWRRGLTLKPATLLSYDGLWRVHIADRWAAVPVTGVTSPAVKAWIAELPVSASRKRHCWHVLSKILQTP
jgi:hypothetical protein